jgi:hypothetical protein
MTKPYPRPYMDVTKDLYKTLLKLQRIMLGSEATTKLQQIDTLIVRTLALRAELTLSLHDALLAEAIYSVVYRCAVRPSLHAFIYTLDSYSYEVRGSGQARTTIPRHA